MEFVGGIVGRSADDELAGLLDLGELGDSVLAASGEGGKGEDGEECRDDEVLGVFQRILQKIVKDG